VNGERPGSHTFTKAEVTERIRGATGLSWSESSGLLEELLEIVKDALASGESVKVSGFGTLAVRQKAARRGRNPQTAQRIVIARRRVLTFKPSAAFRASLNGEESS